MGSRRGADVGDNGVVDQVDRPHPLVVGDEGPTARRVYRYRRGVRPGVLGDRPRDHCQRGEHPAGQGKGMLVEMPNS